MLYIVENCRLNVYRPTARLSVTYKFGVHCADIMLTRHIQGTAPICKSSMG